MRKLLYMVSTIFLLAACENMENTNTNTPSTNIENNEEDVWMDKELLGKWQGMIEIPQATLEIILNLDKSDGNMSVPAQGLNEFPFKAVSYNDSEVNIQIDLAGSLINIAGVLKAGRIEGTFTQNGQSYPITLKPYTEAVVTYEELYIPVVGGELKVALQMPDAPTGTLVVIHAGSGPTNKDGNTIGAGANNSLKMMAEGLAEQGIASIRYDKRGIGENTALIAKEEDLTFDTYVRDVNAIVEYVHGDARFSEVHLLGHSEGALIMTIAAQQNDVASLISIAGIGRTVDEVLMEQLKANLPLHLLMESEKTLQQLKAGQRVASVSAELYSLFRPSVQPYMISWLTYNPQQEINKVTVPILIIQGKNDIQVTATEAEILQAANDKATVHYFEQMNHVLKDIKGNREQNLASYSNPELPLANGLIDIVAEFVK